MSVPAFTPQRFVRCTVTCDVCSSSESFSAVDEVALDLMIAEHGWTRFGPSGQDLCHKCHGASPNTILQVRNA